MKKIFHMILLILCVASAGCVGTPVTFKSPANIKYDTMKGRTVTGSSCGFQLLLFIPININGRQRQAYSDLLANAGPEYYVTDIQVSERWAYAFVGTVYCTDLQATAYPLQAASGN
jgi:hypothetical protein